MSTLAADGMPPLREVIAQHGLAARKSLGQNFLLDLNVTGKIARASGPLDGVSVVEVGPGPGGLTRALLAQGARRVIAIERDERCLPALAEIAAHWPGRLQVIHGDALEIRPADLVGPGPARIVANLPYNVATVLLANWLEADPWPPPFDNFTLMFQREVAERIVAGPSAPRDYGRLSVLAGWRAKSRILFDLPSSVFTPPPKVVSSVVQVVPDPEPLQCRTRDLVAVAQSAFGQRRKMLRQSLKSLGKDPADLLEAAGIDPTARAETVPVAGFVALARALHAARDTRSEA